MPKPAETGLFELDARLFTNGWIHVLEETELSFLCMLADMHAREGNRDALAIPDQVRIGYYGLGLDGYRSHQLLNLAGVIDVEIPEGRRPDGTFKNYSDPELFDSGAPPHRFRLRDDGLAQQALPRMLAASKTSPFHAHEWHMCPDDVSEWTEKVNLLAASQGRGRHAGVSAFRCGAVGEIQRPATLTSLSASSTSATSSRSAL